MKNSKPTGLSAKEKAYVWSKIEAGLAAPRPSVSPLLFWKKAQSKAVAAGLGLLILGGSVTTAYAHSAKPGDFLFPVEIATEKVQIFLAVDQKKKEVLHIKFAEKRLAEVRELTALVHAGVSVNGSTHAPSATTSSTTAQFGTSTRAKGDAKRAVRAERALIVAITQLTETRDALVSKGNANAALVIDDIIEEMKGVGDGTVTITRIAAKGNVKNEKVSVRATLTASSSGGNGFAGTVQIDEKKNGAKILLQGTDIKTVITLGGEKKERAVKERDEDKTHESKKHDDTEEDDDDALVNINILGGLGKKIDLCHVSGITTHTITISANAARAHLAHGDTLGECDATNTPPVLPIIDTTAPVLSTIVANALQTTATISWSTNEQTTARIWLSTSSPVITTTASTQEHATLATTHTFSLSGLVAGTMYYYVVSSADSTGNRATSSQGSFTTTVPADTTAPVISNISTSATGSSATVNWITNENTNGAVYFSQTTPVNTASSGSVTINTLATTHQATLSGLTASTTYHYLIVARDNSLNTATSGEQSFITLGN